MPTILLIEDNEADRAIAKRHISKDENFTQAVYLDARDVKTAKSLISSTQNIDLVICDHNLPDGTSAEILEHIKALRVSCPIVVITGQSSPKIAAEIIKLGAHEYLDKGELSEVGFKKAIASAKKSHRIDNMQIEHLNDLKHFCARVAHDLLTPIGNVTSFIEIAREEHADCEALKIAEKCATEALGMIRHLYRFTAEQKIAPLEFSPAELVSELVQMLREKLGDAIVSVAPLSPLFADRELIRIVFQNILLNAVKFKKPDTPLRVDIFMEGDFISIEDNGIGFPEDKANSIFQPFQRLNPKTHEGHGLGLATCTRIVEAHKGIIKATGEVNKGCKISFTINRNIDGQPEKLTSNKSQARNKLTE